MGLSLERGSGGAGGWVPAGAAQGRRQLAAAAEGTARAAGSQLLLSQGPHQPRLDKVFPAGQRAPPHLQLRSWGERPSAPLILPCPSCKERSLEHGRLCREATCHCLGNSFGLQPIPEGGTRKRRLPELGCGPGECPDKVSWPRDWGCGSAANRFKPGHWTSLLTPKQVPGIVHMGGPDMREIDFHIKKNAMWKNKAEKREFGICLVLGQPSSS